MNDNPMYMEYVDDADSPEPARRRGWRILGWVCIGLSAVMVAGSLTMYGVYRKMFGNIAHEDTNALVGPNRPKKLNSAMNILMLGSDSRAGANAEYGRSMKNEPPRSDTIILLHLSPGGSGAFGVSFPRDLMVPIPSCKKPSGATTPAQSKAQINSAYTLAGPSCTVKTIESLTNLRIDHFMEVNFVGFKSITNAIGGVPVCLPKRVDDPKSKLHLSAGKHTIKGDQALAYVRVRHGLGDGSDLGRIKRQQKFMGALANKALSAGVLSNPDKLLKLINAGTKSLKTDTDLTASTMMKIGTGMQGMTSGKLRFITVPWGPDPADPNRVVLSQPSADNFFNAMRNDRTVPAEKKPAAGGGAPKIPASQVKVRVYNASGIAGQAGRVAGALREQGFQVEVGGNRTPISSTTRIQYGPGADQQAKTLAALMPNAPAPSPATTGALSGMVDLVIGTNWTSTSLKTGKSGGPIPKQQGEIKADDNICDGN
ncbi:LytR family transcriptional regulator [Actinomadura logoneensis]|uniref:LytR family transcriptional regulator n=1 Tax=Actinomadura logoneensis TaxID=2293572 RepID=A0A372JJF8_9ACTN|nr:LCP family protein [Actinomadura logoneensis]RFU40080.1 LytR family transcriptional regulator [Actinomadura logoneensis]